MTTNSEKIARIDKKVTEIQVRLETILPHLATKEDITASIALHTKDCSKSSIVPRKSERLWLIKYSAAIIGLVSVVAGVFWAILRFFS